MLQTITNAKQAKANVRKAEATSTNAAVESVKIMNEAEALRVKSGSINLSPEWADLGVAVDSARRLLRYHFAETLSGNKERLGRVTSLTTEAMSRGESKVVGTGLRCMADLFRYARSTQCQSLNSAFGLANSAGQGMYLLHPVVVSRDCSYPVRDEISSKKTKSYCPASSVFLSC